MKRTPLATKIIARRAEATNEQEDSNELDISNAPASVAPSSSGRTGSGRVKSQPLVEDQLPSSSSISSSSSSSSSNSSWNWVPPREPSRILDDEVIPVISGVLLTSEDIVTALNAQGAENVVIIPLKPKLDSISEFVVATGRSTRHLRKMSDSIVTALKSRNIRQAIGYKGAEGEKDDDWLLIDCHNLVVHLMLPATRKAIDLEAHWLTDANARPHITFSHNEDAYEKSFESLLEKYPVPEDYNASAESYGAVKEEQKALPVSGERERGVQSNSNKKHLPQHIRRL